MTASETRERLLRATIDLLAGPGIGGVSARAVASASGVNQALVFYHFTSVPLLVRESARHSTRLAVQRYRPALAQASSLTALLAVGRRLHAEESARGAVRVMAQLLAAGQSDPEHAETARECLELWFAEVARAVRRLLTDSPVRDLVDVDALARAIGAAFIGLELYEGVDPAGAEAALDSLAGVGVLIEVLDGLNALERTLLQKRITQLRGRGTPGATSRRP
ncbi:MAG: TetR/AcrR family transcriptional regulator [Micropruina sp.]|uniref:TetR/AcrR family transcriptional regulator n=1 Tax=Micropruina sp. TaxID=2737536 RepID=UPI0039E55A98